MKDVNLKLLEKVKVDKIASVNIKLDYVKFWKNFKDCKVRTDIIKNDTVKVKKESFVYILFEKVANLKIDRVLKLLNSWLIK